MAKPRTLRSWEGERVLVLSPTPTHPQDYGNRKRIFEVCSHLQNEGAEITFVHPATLANMTLAAPLPPDMSQLLAILRGNP